MKKWEKPKLTILVRGKPEEVVLETCKSSIQTGPNIVPGGCVPTADALCFSFDACQERRDS
jgi:hypothetical protein